MCVPAEPSYVQPRTIFSLSFNFSPFQQSVPLFQFLSIHLFLSSQFPSSASFNSSPSLQSVSISASFNSSLQSVPLSVSFNFISSPVSSLISLPHLIIFSLFNFFPPTSVSLCPSLPLTSIPIPLLYSPTFFSLDPLSGRVWGTFTNPARND